MKPHAKNYLHAKIRNFETYRTVKREIEQRNKVNKQNDSLLTSPKYYGLSPWVRNIKKFILGKTLLLINQFIRLINE